MKLLLPLLLFFAFNLSAQNNLVVFTQESKPFYVIVNGIRQNTNPETNVKIEDLPGDFYRVKVVFADGETPDVDKSVSFMEKNQEYSLEIKNKRGTYKMRYAGMRPINESTNNGTAITYHEEETHVSSENSTDTNLSTNTTGHQTSISSSSSVNESENISSSVETSRTESGSMDVNVEMNENGVSMHVNVPEGQINSESTQSGVNTNTSVSTTELTTSAVYDFMPNGTMCSTPDVSNKDFIDFKYVLENANMFKRQELILKYFETHCMLSDQIAGLIKIDYSTVDAKKIAKEGYRYTYDTEKYQVVIDALSNDSEKEEVLTFINAGNTSESVDNSSTNENINEEANPDATNNSSNVNYSQIPSYSGYVNCNTSLISDISQVYSNAAKESFADDQRKVIELGTRNRCLSVEQISKLSEIFSHESDKMEFMKWAFNKTYDIDNFYKLSSELTFSSNKEDLDKFIDEQPTGHFEYVYSSTNNNSMLIDDTDLKERMKQESFADDQLALAKQALVSRYISVDQIKNIMSVFSHEGDALDFLKMAYPRTSDQNNFYTLRNELTFDANKEEFDKIIE